MSASESHGASDVSLSSVDVGMWEMGLREVGNGSVAGRPFKIGSLRDLYPQLLDGEKSVLALGFKGIFSCHCDH